MKKLSIVLLGLLAGTLVFSIPAQAKKKKDATTQPATQPVEDSDQIEKSAGDRADSVVKNLNIDDEAKAARVHDILTNQLVAVRQWHQDNDAKIKQLGKDGGDEVTALQAKLQASHADFIAKLSAELTPEQMEIVKEKLTGGQMMATYRNYPEIVPNLTDEEKAKVLDLLKQAREEAMDAGSKNERIAIFKKWKGKINNYLDADGHNVAQAYKDWGNAQKAKKAGASTQPAAAEAAQ
jgi:hypothetical protein